ncbi:MAG: hypothetical protein HC769_21020 [Cyanobacteria bacterium CRU_2_1]|nr:hypothetical protein [Cyanobacteria bacterium RU_5_0]NJR61088.1 hypothetical protein [Cyanobacteria bacterium CRU_2_1]
MSAIGYRTREIDRDAILPLNLSKLGNFEPMFTRLTTAYLSVAVGMTQLDR